MYNFVNVRSKSLILVTIAILSVFSSNFGQVFASENTSLPISTTSEKSVINQNMQTFSFILDDAAIYGSNGQIVDYRWDLIKEKFTQESEIDSIRQLVQQPNRVKRGTTLNCAKDALLEALGLNEVNKLINGGVINMLRNKAYSSAAILVARLGLKRIPVATIIIVGMSFDKCIRN